MFFVGMTFYTHKKSTIRLLLLLQLLPPPRHPKPTMISHVLINTEGMKLKKHNKTKIGVESVVKVNVGELDNITREGRSGNMRKEAVRCVQALVGNNNYLFQF